MSSSDKSNRTDLAAFSPKVTIGNVAAAVVGGLVIGAIVVSGLVIGAIVVCGLVIGALVVDGFVIDAGGFGISKGKT
ncbi:unnamed protein product [Adineta steineri]|uniref:Uncharacterized protein n=1 Tax=Adineta steineri TaxID=433720 RepID=A0A815BD67_9BILA|nr:unnamed protein product [Adineta steineri]CAF4151940.1 unnamed protein product [Adineta steineri]CAF4214307.1 unnamed protein product [Adineta steineri]